MPIPTVDFIYDVDGTPTTFTDIYERGGGGAAIVTLAPTTHGSAFELAIENLDLARNSTFVMRKRCRIDIRPQTVATRVFDGYLTRIRKEDQAAQRAMLLILEGRGSGNRLLPARRFDQDYEISPKDAADVYKDIASGQGITVVNVPASFGITVREPMLLWNRWDAALKVAELSGTDFFVDETLDLNAFKAYPDASTPSTGKTFTDAELKRLTFEQDDDEHYNKVYASYGAIQHIPGDYNEWTNDPLWWSNLQGVTTEQVSVEGMGAKAIRFATVGAPSVLQAQLIDPGALFIKIKEADWQRLTFIVKHSLTGLTTMKLRLTDTASDGIYWERDITADLSSGNWKTLEFKLPSTDATGWTQVGSFGGTVGKIMFRVDGTGMTGAFSVGLLLFYLRAEKNASIVETPLLEKILTDPNTEDPTSLQNLADKELERVKNVFLVGNLEIDGDIALLDPGYTAIINSTRYGIASQTIRLDEITHIVGGKYYRCALGFSNSIRVASGDLFTPITTANLKLARPTSATVHAARQLSQRRLPITEVFRI